MGHNQASRNSDVERNLNQVEEEDHHPGLFDLLRWFNNNLSCFSKSLHRGCGWFFTSGISRSRGEPIRRGKSFTYRLASARKDQSDN